MNLDSGPVMASIPSHSGEDRSQKNATERKALTSLEISEMPDTWVGYLGQPERAAEDNHGV